MFTIENLIIYLLNRYDFFPFMITYTEAQQILLVGRKKIILISVQSVFKLAIYKDKVFALLNYIQ